MRLHSVRPGVVTTAAEQGSALTWALFFVSVTAGLLVSHTWEMRAYRTGMEGKFRITEQARNSAEAGLTDATAYFLRQPAQPVVAFAPQRDPLADPPVDETLDPALGLVREFEIRGNIWGRYEVRHGEAVDVSSSFALPPGSVWDVAARGILFERRDPSRAFDQQPNRQLSIQKLRTEIRGVPTAMPAEAALSITRPSSVSLLNGGRIEGGDRAGMVYATAEALPFLPVSQLTGTVVRVATMTLTPESVFGMRIDQIEKLADIVYPGAVWRTHRPPTDKLVVTKGNLTISPLAPMQGRMVLVVAGDFTALADNNSNLQGLVVVQGNARIEGPFSLRGSLIVRGSLQLGSAAGQPAVVAYDSTAVSSVTTTLARYRRSRDVRPAGTAGTYTPAPEYSASHLANQ
jgi:hypothetical protein